MNVIIRPVVISIFLWNKNQLLNIYIWASSVMFHSQPVDLSWHLNVHLDTWMSVKEIATLVAKYIQSKLITICSYGHIALIRTFFHRAAITCEVEVTIKICREGIGGEVCGYLSWGFQNVLRPREEPQATSATTGNQNGHCSRVAPVAIP